MSSSYPSSLDAFATNKANDTATLDDHAGHHNDLADAVNKIETELGTLPKGSYSDVKTRLNDAVYLTQTSLQTLTGDIALAGAAATNASASASKSLRLRGFYDSNSGAGTTSTAYDMYLKNTAAYNGAAGAGSLGFYNNADSLLMSLSSAGQLDTPAILNVAGHQLWTPTNQSSGYTINATTGTFRQRYTGSGGTITAPAISGLTDNNTVLVEHRGTGVLTITRSSSDTFLFASGMTATSFTILPGEAALITVRSASSVWDTMIIGRIMPIDVITRDTAGTTAFAKADYPTMRGLLVEVLGAGAGGGGVSSTGTGAGCGAGGGGGAYARLYIPVTSLGTSENYTAGTGGGGGTGGATGGTGSNGTASSFGTSPFVSAGGGLGGEGMSDRVTSGSVAGGAGSTTISGGDLMLPGSWGGNGRVVSSTTMVSGTGGQGAVYGGEVRASGAGAAGQDAASPGSGGSGASTAVATGYAGGDGSDGLVVITVL